MKPKSYNYYKLDVGFFPPIIKLCFDDKVFQQILRDHKISLKANALEIGIAETHMVGDGKDAIIVLVFDMSLVDDNDLSELVDTISHEVSHTIYHLAEHIGEDEGFKNETRAYLTGHLVNQIFKICMHEKSKNVRKASRKISPKKSKRIERVDIQVDQHGQRRAGSNSVFKPEDILSGAQDRDGEIITTTNSGV